MEMAWIFGKCWRTDDIMNVQTLNCHLKICSATVLAGQGPDRKALDHHLETKTKSTNSLSYFIGKDIKDKPFAISVYHFEMHINILYSDHDRDQSTVYWKPRPIHFCIKN